MRKSLDELQHFGLNEKSMALMPIAMFVSAASLHYAITIFLNLIKAYDLVQRDHFMAIIDKNSVEMAGNVAILLQAFSVMTTGDETKQTKEANVLKTQEVLAPRALCNNTANALIRYVLHALKIIDDENSPAQIKLFADDISLQVARNVGAEIALRAAGGYASDLVMQFKMDQGKLLEIIEHDSQQKVDGLDAEFISATLMAVTLKRRRNLMTFARALLHLESPEFLRNICANQFVNQLLRMSEGWPKLAEPRPRTRSSGTAEASRCPPF